MKILLVGDVHLADKPPSIRTETYADDIIAKLEDSVKIAEREGVEAVVFAGDVFHIKTPSRTSHALVQRTADVIRAYDRPVGIVPGNHDVTHDRLDSISEQPLGVLFKAGASLVDGVWHDYGGVVFGVPWLQDWSRDLQRYMEAWRSSGASLMVAHAPIVPPGQTRPFEVLDAGAQWVEVMQRPGSVFYGHMHDPDGSYMVDWSPQVEPIWFCNQGAISRGSLHENSLKRIPAVTIWDSTIKDADPFKRVNLKHRAAKNVFRLEDHDRTVAKQQRLDEFLSGVEQTTFEQISPEFITEQVKASALSDEAKGLIGEALEVAR